MRGGGRPTRRPIASAHLRRRAYAAVIVMLAILCVLPRPYVARAKILPGDTSATGLVGVFGALGGQAQNLASLFGDRGATEVSLSIARSQAVTDDVIRRLNIVGKDARYASLREAQIALGKRVDVHSLTGGMIEVETRSPDPDWALTVTRAFVSTISVRIGAYGRAQTARKRRIVDQSMTKALDRLARAEAALNTFRMKNRLADPQAQLGSELALRTSLEGQLLAKLVEQQTLRRTAGPDNPALNVVDTQIAALRRQLDETAEVSNGSSGPSIAGLTSISIEYVNLFRSYTFAQTIYDVYSRSAEEVAVQELIAENATDVAVVDEPHVDPQRYYNVWAAALLGLTALLAFFTEFYAPATGLWDPDGGRDDEGRPA